MSVDRRLETIIRDVLNEPALVYSDELSISNCAAWDSVATVQIVLAVEAEFNVRFTTNEVADVQSVGGLKRLLAHYGATDVAAKS